MDDGGTDICLNVFDDDRSKSDSMKATSVDKVPKKLEKKSKATGGVSHLLPSKKSILAEKPIKRKAAGTPASHHNAKRFKSDEKIRINKPFRNKEKGSHPRKPQVNAANKIDLDSGSEEEQKSDEQPDSDSLFSSSKFSDLELHPHMAANLQQTLGIEKLTLVQKLAIPVISTGRDALIRSPTGSGKTLAYAVPLVEALHSKRPKILRSDGVMAIIVVPTRELALQTYEWFLKLVKPYTWVVPGYLAGGEKRKSEKARLRRGVNILVSTPGRLVDHIDHTRNLQLADVKYLVLDEADRMLDLGYEKDISSIVSALNKYQPWNRASANVDEKDDEEIWNSNQLPRRQTVLLSATLTAAVNRLAGLALKDPAKVEASEGNPEEDSFVIPKNIRQWYIIVPPKLRLVVLAAFIVWKCKMTEEKKLLVFCGTQDMVDYLTDLLAYVLGIPASSKNEHAVNDDDDDEEFEGERLTDVEFFKLHGNMTQTDRTEVFKSFREVDAGVLFCTDVASRGLDLPRVDWVLQWTPPPTPTDYVHRVGRTARGGNTGAALLFLAPSEEPFLRELGQKGIKPKEESIDRCLENLLEVGLSTGVLDVHDVDSGDSAAVDLQLQFENAVLKRGDLHQSGCRAYTSFVRFYATYPKESKEAFSVSNLHLGHYAKGFALRDPPSAIGVSVGRAFKRDRAAARGGGRGGGRMQMHAERRQRPSSSGGSEKNPDRESRSQMLMVSEYASGMDKPKRKRKRKDDNDD
ncbi:probable ATP-dependent RNA helicase DDX31 [Ischnura elegans]|uniref:probable ATP-dependent RNA helicase DDX31 n=1 Tax=Ischnura elegans TaxID=197161 RepID=UPI001ED86AB0|nr:probable ATP-dependent RNA helicase DDX31 [Ischnura elegans]